MIFYVLLILLVAIIVILFRQEFEYYCKWCIGRQRYPKVQETIYSTIFYRPRKWLKWFSNSKRNKK